MIEHRDDLAALMAARPGHEPPTAADRLLDALRRPEWHQRAACRGEGPDRWFSNRQEDVEAASAICATCAVVRTCRAQAEADDTRHGVWGGVHAKTIHLRRHAA